MPGKNLKLADDFARDYDNLISENRWNGPEILFNKINKFLKPKSKILDLGIGTGASSVPFKKAGHFITGLDGSSQMLEQCKKKQITDKLILHNLEKPPFPFKNEAFDSIISCGVFHLVHPILPIFSEVNRLLVPGGYFGFTYENSDGISVYNEIESGIWEMKTESGVLTYKQSGKYISELLFQNNFKIKKQTRFLAYVNRQLQKEYYFTAIVAMLKQDL